MMRRGIVEKIAFVFVAQLFARHGKGWARQPACKQVQLLKVCAGQLLEVLTKDPPTWAVVAKRSDAMFVDVDQEVVVKPCLLQPECLSAGASAHLN